MRGQRRFSLTLLLSLAFAAGAQIVPPPEPQSTPVLSKPADQDAYDQAKANFSAGHFAEAFATLRTLHDHLADDIDLLRFTCEAALDSNENAYVISALATITATRPGNWQELMLLARAYAQSHDATSRDATLAKLTEEYNSNRHPKLNAINQFLIERIPIPSGRMDIYYALAPWSRYKIYEMARVYNASGQQVQRLTLESSDFDQPLWAKSHPDQAAQGVRMFSLDGYGETQPGPNGTSTQTHSTFGFLDGKPTYDALRDRWITITTGKSGPLSTSKFNTAPPTPKQ
jgi:hypothetical protein